MIKYAGLIVMLLLGLGLGFWLGQQQPVQTSAIPAVAERKPLYYRHPMNPQVTSPTPAKDDMGMDYLPVYPEDQSTPEAKPQSGKILYYRHPMGAPDTSPVPKKDEMGMDYLPVYESEPESSGQIRISPEKNPETGRHRRNRGKTHTDPQHPCARQHSG